MNGCTTTIRVVEERYFPESWSEPKIVQLTPNGGNPQDWVVTAIPNFGSTTDIGVVFKVTPFVSSDNYTIDLVLEPLIQTFVGYNTAYSYSIKIPESNNTTTTSESTVVTNGNNTTTTNTTTTGTNGNNNSNNNNNIQRYFTYERPMPIIATRSLKTRLRVYDGDTIVMGGALKDKTITINDIVPILGDIPLVGRAFQSEIESIVKTNLLIFTKVNLVLPDGSLLRPAKEGGRASFLDTF